MIQYVGEDQQFPPCWLYAHAWQEMIREWGIGSADRMQNGADPETGLLPDGSTAGRGLFQLTSSFPVNWANPVANAKYAVKNFLAPLIAQWLEKYPGMNGEVLIKCVAASYNAGFEPAYAGHLEGNCDKYTTNNYGTRVLLSYQQLINGDTLT
jgi:hypothetical protein